MQFPLKFIMKSGYEGYMKKGEMYIYHDLVLVKEDHVTPFYRVFYRNVVTDAVYMFSENHFNTLVRKCIIVIED